MSHHRKHRKRRRGLALAAALAVTCAASGGCSGLVRGVVMAPIHAAEAVAVETAKVPFDAAKAGTDVLVNAAFRGK